MASITRQRNGKYRAQIRRQGHRSISKTFGRYRDAKTWANQAEREIEAGRRLNPGRRTLGDAVRAYLSSARGQRLGTHERSVLNWWMRELGGRELQDLRRGDFVAARERLKGRRSRPLQPATINRRMSCISAVLTAAVERDWIEGNPARIRRLREDNARERLLNDRERGALLAACRKSREPALFAFVLTAMTSGARAGELTNLRWQFVDLNTGTLRLIKTKSGVRRPAPLRGRALDEVRNLSRQREGSDPQDYVFMNRSGRAPFRYRRAWDAARRQAGLTDVRLHDVRHLVASELAMAGTSTTELQALLGHASPQQTQRYSHFIESRIIELGDRLVARLFPDWRPGQDDAPQREPEP